MAFDCEQQSSSQQASVAIVFNPQVYCEGCNLLLTLSHNRPRLSHHANKMSTFKTRSMATGSPLMTLDDARIRQSQSHRSQAHQSHQSHQESKESKDAKGCHTCTRTRRTRRSPTTELTRAHSQQARRADLDHTKDHRSRSQHTRRAALDHTKYHRSHSQHTHRAAIDHTQGHRAYSQFSQSSPDTHSSFRERRSRKRK
ncbi:hypothetical protein K402DRAFT_188844 [Aulographum hederae CBS 113979]|uniref:Uncharacterized protein n=1 Tax=Aulographum hederae CBS 113979 TaxID=1176131 RepID=A0A6G1GPP1_9PEZI|nr:hypothetical protein K402DRAFT_188844 [Aulographum hederae CBS 113979]